jgi:hypothetical protein
MKKEVKRRNGKGEEEGAGKEGRGMTQGRE